MTTQGGQNSTTVTVHSFPAEYAFFSCSSSKFGVVGFSEALQAEMHRLKKEGIKVSTVCPVGVNTNLLSSVAHRAQYRDRSAVPFQIRADIAFLFHSDWRGMALTWKFHKVMDINNMWRALFSHEEDLSAPYHVEIILSTLTHSSCFCIYNQKALLYLSASSVFLDCYFLLKKNPQI